MNFPYDHDRYVSKNKSLARGYDVDKRDGHMEKRGFSHTQRQQEASCFNCKLKRKCAEFRKRRSGGSLGAASFDGSESFLCDKYIPEPASDKKMSQKQIKSLLKNAKMGHRL